VHLAAGEVGDDPSRQLPLPPAVDVRLQDPVAEVVVAAVNQQALEAAAVSPYRAVENSVDADRRSPCLLEEQSLEAVGRQSLPDEGEQRHGNRVGVYLFDVQTVLGRLGARTPRVELCNWLKVRL